MQTPPSIVREYDGASTPCYVDGENDPPRLTTSMMAASMELEMGRGGGRGDDSGSPLLHQNPILSGSGSVESHKGRNGGGGGASDIVSPKSVCETNFFESVLLTGRGRRFSSSSQAPQSFTGMSGSPDLSRQAHSPLGMSPAAATREGRSASLIPTHFGSRIRLLGGIPEGSPNGGFSPTGTAAASPSASASPAGRSSRASSVLLSPLSNPDAEHRILVAGSPAGLPSALRGSRRSSQGGGGGGTTGGGSSSVAHRRASILASPSETPRLHAPSTAEDGSTEGSRSLSAKASAPKDTTTDTAALTAAAGVVPVDPTTTDVTAEAVALKMSIPVLRRHLTRHITPHAFEARRKASELNGVFGEASGCWTNTCSAPDWLLNDANPVAVPCLRRLLTIEGAEQRARAVAKAAFSQRSTQYHPPHESTSHSASGGENTSLPLGASVSHHFGATATANANATTSSGAHPFTTVGSGSFSLSGAAETPRHAASRSMTLTRGGHHHQRSPITNELHRKSPPTSAAAGRDRDGGRKSILGVSHRSMRPDGVWQEGCCGTPQMEGLDASKISGEALQSRYVQGLLAPLLQQHRTAEEILRHTTAQQTSLIAASTANARRAEERGAAEAREQKLVADVLMAEAARTKTELLAAADVGARVGGSHRHAARGSRGGRGGAAADGGHTTTTNARHTSALALPDEDEEVAYLEHLTGPMLVKLAEQQEMHDENPWLMAQSRFGGAGMAPAAHPLAPPDHVLLAMHGNKASNTSNTNKVAVATTSHTTTLASNGALRERRLAALRCGPLATLSPARPLYDDTGLATTGAVQVRLERNRAAAMALYDGPSYLSPPIQHSTAHGYDARQLQKVALLTAADVFSEQRLRHRQRRCELFAVIAAEETARQALVSEAAAEAVRGMQALDAQFQEAHGWRR